MIEAIAEDRRIARRARSPTTCWTCSLRQRPLPKDGPPDHLDRGSAGVPPGRLARPPRVAGRPSVFEPDGAPGSRGFPATACRRRIGASWATCGRARCGRRAGSSPWRPLRCSEGAPRFRAVRGHRPSRETSLHRQWRRFRPWPLRPPRRPLTRQRPQPPHSRPLPVRSSSNLRRTRTGSRCQARTACSPPPLCPGTARRCSYGVGSTLTWAAPAREAVSFSSRRRPPKTTSRGSWTSLSRNTPRGMPARRPRPSASSRQARCRV